MFTHKAEQHYFDLYYPIIKSHLAPDSKILDIGCQNGRFTIPLAHAGHNITATDINDKYFSFIKTHLRSSDHVDFCKEDITATISNQPKSHFDAILCLELLYTMSNHAEFLQSFRNLMKPDGLLFASHRTLGYYVYRYLKEKKFEDLQKILANKHPVFNSQTAENITQIYTEAGYSILDIKPVGMFSGFSRDPFDLISNPETLNEQELKKLLDLENNSDLQSLFRNNARYLLVAARVKS